MGVCVFLARRRRLHAGHGPFRRLNHGVGVEAERIVARIAEVALCLDALVATAKVRFAVHIAAAECGVHFRVHCLCDVDTLRRLRLRILRLLGRKLLLHLLLEVLDAGFGGLQLIFLRERNAVAGTQVLFTSAQIFHLFVGSGNVFIEAPSRHVFANGDDRGVGPLPLDIHKALLAQRGTEPADFRGALHEWQRMFDVKRLFSLDNRPDGEVHAANFDRKVEHLVVVPPERDALRLFPCGDELLVEALRKLLVNAVLVGHVKLLAIEFDNSRALFAKSGIMEPPQFRLGLGHLVFVVLDAAGNGFQLLLQVNLIRLVAFALGGELAKVALGFVLEQRVLRPGERRDGIVENALILAVLDGARRQRIELVLRGKRHYGVDELRFRLEPLIRRDIQAVFDAKAHDAHGIAP